MKQRIVALGMVVLGGTTLAVQAQAHEGHAHSHSHGGHHVSTLSQAQAEQMPVSRTLGVADCWIRLLPAPAPSGGYFVVHNQGQEPVKLVGAASPQFGMVMLHQTTHEGGMSKMSMTDEVEIPAGQQLAFKPGDYHAMLEQPQKNVKVGSQIALELYFGNGEKAEAECEVRPPNTVSH